MNMLTSVRLRLNSIQSQTIERNSPTVDRDRLLSNPKFGARGAVRIARAPVRAESRRSPAQAAVIRQADSLLWRIRRDPDHMPKVN